MESQQSTISDDRLTAKEHRLLRLAFDASYSATCPREKHGCIIARCGIIVATGYNGSADGEPHCDEVGCDIVSVTRDSVEYETDCMEARFVQHCVRTIHAEINAITNAAILGVSIEGCDWYITGVPCSQCSSVILRTHPRFIWLCTDRGGVDKRSIETRLTHLRSKHAVCGISTEGLIDRGILREGEL